MFHIVYQIESGGGMFSSDASASISFQTMDELIQWLAPRTGWVIEGKRVRFIVSGGDIMVYEGTDVSSAVNEALFKAYQAPAQCSSCGSMARSKRGCYSHNDFHKGEEDCTTCMNPWHGNINA